MCVFYHSFFRIDLVNKVTFVKSAILISLVTYEILKTIVLNQRCVSETPKTESVNRGGGGWESVCGYLEKLPS